VRKYAGAPPGKDCAKTAMNEKQNYAITISRQMGSGGSYVGYLVSRELGFRYVDREVLSRAANLMGTSEDWAALYDERSSTIVEDLLKSLTFGTPEAASLIPPKPPVYDRKLFALECRIMNDIVDRSHAVIVGRAGFYALRNRPGVIRLFIHAPREFRVRRIMEVRNIQAIEEARAVVDESDRNRAVFIRDMTGYLWSDARNFHLSVDSSAVGFPAITEMVVNLARRVFSP